MIGLVEPKGKVYTLSLKSKGEKKIMKDICFNEIIGVAINDREGDCQHYDVCCH